jgi:LemA protein
MNTTTYIIISIILVLVVMVIGLYNGLVTLNNRVKEAWSDINVQLKRRYDLIPNLIETVKGYAKHESSVFTNVTKARTEAMQAKGIDDKGKAENQLSQTLKSIFAVAENYPDLKASANFLSLQDELTDTENKIEAARRFYNGNVRDFNTKLQTFPTNIFGKQLGFSNQPFFEMDEAEAAAAKDAPKVQF